MEGDIIVRDVFSEGGEILNFSGGAAKRLRFWYLLKERFPAESSLWNH